MPVYRIAGRTFPTKESLKQHIRAVRDQTPLGGTTEDPVLLRLLSMHPQWADKSEGMTAVGTGMVKGTPYAPPQKQIVLLRGDREPMDISWTKLVARLQPDGTLKHPTDAREALDELRVACRQLIEPQLAGLRLPGMHVDHVYPNTFERLLFDWVSLMWDIREEKVPDLKVGSTDGLVVLRYFENPYHADSWANYHRLCSELEVITPEEHARRPVIQMDWEPLLS
jgi:hypothetical protein